MDSGALYHGRSDIQGFLFLSLLLLALPTASLFVSSVFTDVLQ